MDVSKESMLNSLRAQLAQARAERADFLSHMPSPDNEAEYKKACIISNRMTERIMEIEEEIMHI